MRELTGEDTRRMDDLHLEVRRETNLQRQIELVNQIAQILGYPKVNPRGKWARQLVGFICAGTDEESTSSASGKPLTNGQPTQVPALLTSSTPMLTEANGRLDPSEKSSS